MANTSNWGKIYCSTEWGAESNQNIIKNESAPACLVVQQSCGGAYSSLPSPATMPHYINVTLGANTGVVTLNFDAYGAPDKFEVWFEGQKVIDTGYRGDGAFQSSLNDALASFGLPPETIQGTGSGTATFTKSTTGTMAQVRVYAPLASNSFEFNLSCPV